VASTKLIYVPFFLGAKRLHVLLQISLSQEHEGVEEARAFWLLYEESMEGGKEGSRRDKN